MASYIKASTFYIEGMLGSLNAIKRKSFFNSATVIDAQMLDIVVTGMVEWAAIIGSQEPSIARKILKSFQSTMKEEDMLNGVRVKWSKNCPSNTNPVYAILPRVFQADFDNVEMKLFQSFDTQVDLAGCCIEALLWGISYPDAVTSDINDKEQKRASLYIYQKIDSKINHILTFSDIHLESKKLAEKYLSTVPSGVL